MAVRLCPDRSIDMTGFIRDGQVLEPAEMDKIRHIPGPPSRASRLR